MVAIGGWRFLMSEMLLYLEYISNAEVMETSRQQILSRVHEIDRLLEA